MSWQLFIIIMTLIIAMAPIMDAFLKSELAKALAERIRGSNGKRLKSDSNKFDKLEEKIDEQSQILYSLQEQNQTLEQKYDFLERLLEPPKNQ